jgi:hypothetical protein
LRGFNAETGAADMTLDTLHLDAAADRGFDLPSIGLEIVGYGILGRKAIRIAVRELHSGETVVPGRAVGNQRVPPLGTPALGDTATLEDEV